MKLIRITAKDCPFCPIQIEVMRRLLPKFPELEIVDLDRDDDREEVDRYHIQSVPALVLNGKTLVGTHTLGETERFLKESIACATKKDLTV